MRGASPPHARAAADEDSLKFHAGQYVRVAEVSMIYALVAQKSQFPGAQDDAGHWPGGVAEAAGGDRRDDAGCGVRLNPNPPAIPVAAHEREPFFR